MAAQPVLSTSSGNVPFGPCSNATSATGINRQVCLYTRQSGKAPRIRAQAQHGKGYATKGDAGEILQDFRQDGVDSGRGYVRAFGVCTSGGCGSARCRKLCWSVDSRFAPLNRLPYPGETPFRRPFDALGWQIVRFLQIVTKKGRFQRLYLQKTHNG